MTIREDMVHFAVRSFLRSEGWMLIAGEYPDGTDDELWPLQVVDPTLARDNSPDHRRHSMNKLVPDLVAGSDSDLLLIEMKPEFDHGDEAKLDELLSDRREDLDRALSELLARGKVDYQLPNPCRFIPAMGFQAGSPFVPRKGWMYFLVSDDLTVSVVDTRT